MVSGLFIELDGLIVHLRRIFRPVHTIEVSIGQVILQFRLKHQLSLLFGGIRGIASRNYFFCFGILAAILIDDDHRLGGNKNGSNFLLEVFAPGVVH